MPQKFNFDLERRGSWTTGGVQAAPDGVQFVPLTWSDRADWGYDLATVQATGAADRLGELLAWVGSRVSIRNELGTVVWFGYLHEVMVNFGGSQVTTGLDGVYNRICVAYSTRLPDGSQERRTTAWAEDTASIAQYGTREVRLGADDVSDDNALALRDLTLAKAAWPAPTLRTQAHTQAPPTATLYCKGYRHLLDAVYYENPNGLADHTTASKGEQALRAYTTGTTISFGTYADPAGGADDIKDSASGFVGLAVNDNIFVTGATNGANNGAFALVSANATNIETVDKGRVNEAAGASVTVAYNTPATTDLAQTFKLPTGAAQWACKTIAIRCYANGAPTGNLGVSLHAEEGLGYPGTELDYGQLACSSLPDRMAWIELSMVGGDVMLQPDTWYWIKVTTSAPLSIAAHVVVGLDETESLAIGAGRINYLTGWAVRDPAFDMPFRITGRADSLTLVQEIIGLSDDVAAVTVRTTGLQVWQYREGERTALDEANELLALGSSGGERILVRWVSQPEGVNLSGVTLDVPAASDDANPVLDAHGRLRQATGAPWEAGLLAAGRWVDLEFLPVLDGVAAQAKGAAILIERSQYNALSDTISLESQGVANPLMGVGRAQG